MDSLVTIVAEVRRSDVPALRERIEALGNPPRDEVRDALDALDGEGGGTHFLSLHALATGDEETGHLVLEFTADGPPRRAIGRIVAAIGPHLQPIFAESRGWRSHVGLANFLDAHRIRIGPGLFDNPGLAFAGTPRMTVGRVRAEDQLQAFVAPLIGKSSPGLRPIDRLAAIRRTVAQHPGLAWALEPPPPPVPEPRPPSTPALIAGLVLPFLRNFLWPAGIAVAAVFLVALLAGAELDEALVAALIALAATAVLAVLGLGLGFVRLRRLEESDWTDPRAPDPAVLREIRERENRCAQNHMISVTERKPGAVRWFTLRFIFWLIGQLARRVYRTGFLGDISTIHAARWVTIPGTRKLIFFSNYGGSWESYLEDFITRAHGGLTAVWSNSIGFPKAKNLFQKGATDGERFKRYARASMLPTPFWYSAYPHLTTDHVRCNAALRRGLAAALTNDEAAGWLALFGSAPRPDAMLETSQIPSLAFGGLGFMPHGTCLLLDLPEDREAARGLLAAIYPHAAFGDGRKLPQDAIVLVALGPGALARLGLPGECIRGFPAAFLEGMAAEGRDRVLGDLDASASEHWEWGRTAPDLALLVYGKSEAAVAKLAARIEGLAAERSMPPPHAIPLVPTKKPAIEPFGFVDGISQPVIRGGPQSFRKNDPIHLVEPGEFLIGYPDNRGNFPPEPELSPLADPHNLLPVAERSPHFGSSIVDAPRAIGRNGTFLVIRQLEQDVEGFWSYCKEQAGALRDRLPPPYDVDEEFVAAKLVGRWPNGSSLVRNPYHPFEREQRDRIERRARRVTADRFKADDPTDRAAVAASEAAAVAASGQPVGSQTARPETHPDAGRPIDPPTEPSFFGDNDFLYGVEDPQALRCPFGAHIRRANPRDSLAPGSMEQVSISNRHRIFRVGRLYRPAANRNPGLLFMCLNGDIERQFEFIQQTWLVSPAFHGLVGEQDPLTSDARTGATGFLIPTQDGPVRLDPLKRFVRTLGGGYFFMPGRSFLAWLSGV